MRFDTSQHMKMGQHMKLAPRMIQSMEILQMPLAELEERIEQELESNPTLELGDGGPADGSREPVEAEAFDDDKPLTVSGESGGDDFERLDRYEESNPEAAENQYGNDLERAAAPDSSWERLEPGSYSASRMAGERDGKMDAMAAAQAPPESLAEQLLEQWALSGVDPALSAIGEVIIAHLEEDGYLRTPLELIAERTGGAPMAIVERALRAVQLLLDPAGVAARTPAECMVLQLDALEAAGESDWPSAAFANARRIVEHHLEDVTQNRLPKVAERTGLGMNDIKEALTLLRRLSLSPARRLVQETTRPIIPDAIVEYDEGQDRYIAYLNDSRLQVVRINEEYARLVKDKNADKRDRDFLRTNLANAQWLLDAVGQRRHTLLRVVRAVVEAQRDYFDYGPQALKPLPMTGVGEQLGIHVATVSRAVADKYLATPRGIVPLRKFFSGGVTTRPDAGETPNEMAWDAIKDALREVIGAESKEKPLSDEALVEELKKRGIEIARRTVAKYRDQLGIPSARMRKTF